MSVTVTRASACACTRSRLTVKPPTRPIPHARALIAAARQRLAHTPPGYRYSIGRVLAVYCGVMVTIVLASLDQTIVATALPHIVSDIGGFADYSWVFSAYLLFQTVTIPIYGKLGDIHGRRPMLLAAILIFLAGSALCAVAQNMTELIAFRCIQGIGAGGLIPLAITTIGDLVPPRARGKYQGLVGTAFGLAGVAGPAAGGIISDNTSWRWIFLVNLPVGGLALLVVAVTMPRLKERKKHSIDQLGAALLTLGTGAFLLGLVWGGRAHPWLSVQVLGAIAAAVLLIGLFALQEQRSHEPLLPVEMLREPVVVAGAACWGVAAMCQIGTIAYVPLFVQGVIGASATSSGVILSPFILGAVISSVLAGQVVARTGHYRTNLLLGPIVQGIGMTLLWRMGINTSRTRATVDMFVTGIGMGLMMPVFVIAAQNAVPSRMLGSTTAFMQFVRALGTTLGAAVFGVIVNQGLPSNVRGGENFFHTLSLHGREQLASAIRPAFLFGMGTCVLLLAIVLVGVKQRPLRETFDDEPAPPEELAAAVP
jgi:EmrB/QacA subfamily drug resistance transporter